MDGRSSFLDRLTKTMVGFDTGRESAGVITVLAARKKLADTTELQSDPELNSNSQFSEMREAIRTTSSNIGAAITRRVHFYLALRQMLVEIVQSGDARVPAIEHVYRWFVKTRAELPPDAAGMSLRLDMGSLHSPSHKSSVNPVAGAGDWISQLSYRPPLIHTQRDAASYPSGSVSSRPALNIPSQAQPALRHASLERLATFRTRNLLESHALRTGRTRADLEREVSRQPYAPREADPAVSTARLRASMRPATAAPSYGSSSSTTGAVLGPDQSLLQVERDVASMSGAQQREQAAAARFQAQTRSLVAEWDAEMARFEEETARKIEYSMISKFRRPESAVSAESASRAGDVAPHVVDGVVSGPRTTLAQHHPRTAWSTDITKVPDMSANSARKPKEAQKDSFSSTQRAWSNIDAPPAPVSEAEPAPAAAAAAAAAAASEEGGTTEGESTQSIAARPLPVFTGKSPLDARPTLSALMRLQSGLGAANAANVASLAAERAEKSSPAPGVSLSAFRLRPTTAAPVVAVNSAAAPQTHDSELDLSQFASVRSAALSRTAAVHAAAKSQAQRMGIMSHPATARPHSTVVPTGEEADPLSTLRPFSAHIARSEELVRLDQVRSTLARRGVHVPQAALERALVTPVVNFDATQQKAMLIGSGDLLMKNPFAAADESSGKAKSSKGKGKAKKGGKKKK